MSLAVWSVKKQHMYVYEDEKGMWSFQGQNTMYLVFLCTGQKICTIFDRSQSKNLTQYQQG